MTTRCQPGDLVIVDAKSGLDLCAHEFTGFTFVVREKEIIATGFLIGYGWMTPSVLRCPRCGGTRDWFLDVDLRPLRGPATASGDAVETPRTRIEEPAHG